MLSRAKLLAGLSSRGLSAITPFSPDVALILTQPEQWAAPGHTIPPHDGSNQQGPGCSSQCFHQQHRTLFSGFSTPQAKKHQQRRLVGWVLHASHCRSLATLLSSCTRMPFWEVLVCCRWTPEQLYRVVVSVVLINISWPLQMPL